MLLAQGKFWHVALDKRQGAVVVGLHRESLSEDLRELRDFRIEIPLGKWTRVIKQVRTDRKLLGGAVLDFAVQKDHLATALGNDQLYGELQRALLDACATLVEMGVLVLSVSGAGGD